MSRRRIFVWLSRAYRGAGSGRGDRIFFLRVRVVLIKRFCSWFGFFFCARFRGSVVFRFVRCGRVRFGVAWTGWTGVFRGGTWRGLCKVFSGVGFLRDFWSWRFAILVFGARSVGLRFCG